jgi:RHS repeat-associated protein
LSGSLNQVLSFRYNNDFQPVEAAYAGASTGYGYDADGLLIQAGGYSIARHAGNGLPLEVSGQGFVMNRAFNGYGELSGQSVSVGGRDPSAFNLARDASGRITRRSEAFGGAAAAYDYFYDANGRLTKVLKEGLPAEEYAYDETGTRIYEKNTRRGIAGRSFEYSDEDHLLKAGEWAYQYDLDGFLTSKTNQTNSTNRTQYVYSSRGELLTVLLPEGKRIDYVHDPLGRRIAKRVNGVVVEKYLWQGMTRLLAVFSSSDALLMRFEYAADRLPVAMTAGGYRYFLAYDQVGSLRLVVNGAGSVVKSIQYDSFGNILEETNPAFTIPLGFAGGLHDPDTGLLRFGYRDYDPDVGRWTAKDPIGFAGGDTDLYGYVLNDPINFIDPRGLWGIKYGGSLIGIDFSAALYDSDKGWFPNATTDIGVSTTAFGGGIQITFDTGVESRSNPCEDVNVSMGMGKYLGVTYNTELSRGSVNLGLGLGLPLTLSTPIKNFTQGLSNSLQRVFH